ncbi:MAG: hypothetical protein GXX96_38905 [Planctomycetaceae bacterium]|nr:hypothetical protein [Planctomycetaceae bacterium]
MLFWWLTIGFAVVWAIAVVIEVVWFWGPDEEPEPSPGSVADARQGPKTTSPSIGAGNAEVAADEEFPVRVTSAGG